MKSVQKEQINLWVEKSWRERLKEIARRKAFELNCDYSYLNLIYDLLSGFLSGSVEKEEK
jgi:hypothetical protein